MADFADTSFPVTNRNRVRRKPDRGRFDRATVYDILDAAMVAHIAYVIDGQPYCTPTGFWREDDKLYWHGSSASRMIRSQSAGVPVCVTATHLDAIVLARSGFHHSVNYRSVMAFGTARLVTDAAEKTPSAGWVRGSVLSGAVEGNPAGHRAGDQGDQLRGDADRRGVRQNPFDPCHGRRGGLRPAGLDRPHSGASGSGRAGTVPAAIAGPGGSGGDEGLSSPGAGWMRCCWRRTG